jgi:hypothetical protein
LEDPGIGDAARPKLLVDHLLTFNVSFGFTLVRPPVGRDVEHQQRRNETNRESCPHITLP